MKYLFFLLFFYSCSAFSQLDSLEIETAFEAYFLNIENRNAQGSMEYMHPAIFDLIPQEMMLALLEETVSDTSILMSDASVTSMLELEDSEQGHYVLVVYNYEMSVYDYIDSTAIIEDVESDFSFLADFYKELYSEERVQSFPDERKIVINLDKELIAISEPIYEGWKFLESPDSPNQMLQQILPASIMTLLEERSEARHQAAQEALENIEVEAGQEINEELPEETIDTLIEELPVENSEESEEPE